MGWQAWATLAVVAAAFASMARGAASPATAILGAVILLLGVGILTPAQAFAGFSNPAPITVAGLYVLARAVEKTGALRLALSRALGSGGSERRDLLRLLAPAAGASAFLNNTPIVAMLIGEVTAWAERHGRSASRYLMPLSFAVILGGVVTTIGTSTNLVVSGLLEASGREPFGLFELTPVGLPVAALGIAALVLLAPRLLPERVAPSERLAREEREFVVRMEVVSDGPLDGRSVEDASLRSLAGVFLVELERDGEPIAPVAPETVLRGGDRLAFVGRAESVLDLQGRPGLASVERQHLRDLETPRHRFFEAVIGPASPLVGRTPKELGFRGLYQAAIAAVHREGERVPGKLGEVRLGVGDSLLVLADAEFAERWRDRADFLLVTPVHAGPGPAAGMRGRVALLTLPLLAAAAAGWLPILHAALLGALGLVVLRVLSPREARDAVDLDVLVVIAGSFGLGAAVEQSGLARELGVAIVDGFGGLGWRAVLLGVVAATLLLTEFISNNAAAALMFPIAMAAAADVGAEERAFAIAVAVSASASFLTPVGYQTNTMVFGPGGYHFSDYVRVGAPLTAVVVAVVLATA